MKYHHLKEGHKMGVNFALNHLQGKCYVLRPSKKMYQGMCGI